MTPQRQNATRRTGRRAKSLAPLLAALLAVFLQAFVVQTHVHAFALGAPAIERSQNDTSHAEGVHVVSAHHAAACVFCEALRSSARTILPPVVEIVGERQVLVEAYARALPATPQTVSHAWRSRAPPQAV